VLELAALSPQSFPQRVAMQELFVLGGLLAVISAVLAAYGFRGREQVVGIDLGTTFSVVALRSQDKVTVIPDRFTGKLLIPSVVAYLQNGSVFVGDPAVRLRDEFPERTIFNSKRFIGRAMHEVTEDAASHPFNTTHNGSSTALSNASQAAAGFFFPNNYGGKWISPVDVGASVVKHMKLNVHSYIGYPIKRAVICVPAKFSPKETKATQQAFEKAGIKVMRVLEEPTAAAVAYNLHKTSGVRHVLVYDIGGGTLDTSLLYMNGKAVNVLGIAGDDHLGGSDFDRRMQELLQTKLPMARRLADYSPPLHRCDKSSLNIIGEEAKIKLSSERSIEVQCLADDGIARSMVVTREEFETSSADLFDRAIQPVEQVLSDQMMTADNIDDVVLVGGASRTPRLRELLQQFFGPSKRLHTEIDPDITVAYGAANIVD